MCWHFVVESTNEDFPAQVGLFNISGGKLAGIELILVDLELPVNSALQLTDVSFVPQLLEGGEDQVLDIDDRFPDPVPNLFRNFNPAIGTELSVPGQVSVTRKICVFLQILLERVLRGTFRYS